MRGVWLNLDKSSILNPIFASCSNLNFIYNALIMIMLVLVHMKSKIFDNVLYDIWSNWEKPDAPENSFTALSIKAKKCVSLRCSYQWVQKMSPLHSFNTNTCVQNTLLDARLNVNCTTNCTICGTISSVLHNHYKLPNTEYLNIQSEK